METTADFILECSRKSPIGYLVKFKNNVKISKGDDPQKRLDFIMKLNPVTGKPDGVAWKNFGYRGPKFHDGFLYGKPDDKINMSGKGSFTKYVDGILRIFDA